MTPLPPSMQAWRLDRFGGPEVIGLARLPLPSPGPGEALVKVQAASVNPADWKIREGRHPSVDAGRLPCVLGRDLAGEVVACGRGEDFCREGDRLYALLGIDRGSWAEYTIVRRHEAAPAPLGLAPAEAAALPLAGLTAWQGLFRHGELRAGQRVLIHGAAGGVGHLAVQFAKTAGAWVATSVSRRHAEFVHGLGANLVIDHEAGPFERAVAGVDLVLDLVGGETQRRSWAVLKPGGTLVSTVGEPDAAEAARWQARGLGFTAAPNAGELVEIARLVESQQVRVAIARRYELKHGEEALRSVEAGHAQGKVVLLV